MKKVLTLLSTVALGCALCVPVFARAKHRLRAAQPGSGVDAELLDASRRVHGPRRREILDGPGTAGALDSPGVIQRFVLFPLALVENRPDCAMAGRLELLAEWRGRMDRRLVRVSASRRLQTKTPGK